MIILPSTPIGVRRGCAPIGVVSTFWMPGDLLEHVAFVSFSSDFDARPSRHWSHPGQPRDEQTPHQRARRADDRSRLGSALGSAWLCLGEILELDSFAV